MSANYLNEAFTQLQLLNEEEFNLTDKDSIEDIKSLVDAPVDASIDIIDPDANSEDELSDSYVGKVVLDCSVCHSKIYKDPSEIVIDEVEELANVGEECPYCYTADGFKVLGQIAPFSDDVKPTEDEVSEEEADDVVEDDTDDDEDDTDDDEDDDFMEALSEKLSQMNEAEMSDEDKRDNQILRNIYDKTQRRANAALTPEEQAVLDKYGLYRSTGNKDIMKPGKDAFHASSITSPPRYFKGGVDVHDDRVNLADRARKISDRQPIRDFVNSGDYHFYDTTYDHDPQGNYKNTFQRKMNRAHSAQMQQPMQDMKRLISTRNYEQDRLDKADANYKDAIAKAKSDYEKRMKSAEDSLASTKKYASKSVNDANAEIDRMLKRGKKEDMEESLEKVEVSTEDSNTVITNDPVTNTVSVTTTTNDDGEGILVPLSDENAEEIAASTEENAEVPEEDNFVADEFDEESFDELGEAYLKKVYENIDAFKTTNVSSCGKKLAVEGLITFKSGNTKPTHFIFEQKAQNKKGTYRFIGENKQISRGKKSFILQGNVNNNKFICESLNYNYLGKNDGDKKSVRLYGTIKRGMNNG